MGQKSFVEDEQKDTMVVNKPWSESSSTPIKKPQIHENQNLEVKFVSPTPEKTNETLNVRCKKEPAELPENYKTLSEFFDRMTTSLRLLNLRKQLPTFQNISRQVEILTKRKFSYKHLAQIKFIFPEAIQAEKILLHNKKTLCMEPDIKITLLFDIIEGHNGHSPYIALCHIFSDRLFKFVNTNPKGCDVPEAELPEPFNKKEITISSKSLPVGPPTKTLPNINEAELLTPSLLPPSFKRHFSRKKEIENSTKTELSQIPVLPSSDTTNDKETGFSSCLDTIEHDEDIKDVNGVTPMKPPSVSNHKLTIETPDLSTPKRAGLTGENKLENSVGKKSVANNLFAKRSLDFSIDENEECLEEETAFGGISFGKVEDKINYTSKNDSLDLVETIHNIFSSANRSSIPKSELIHKILVNNLEIIDKGEIEEELENLVKRVPDWISKKVDPNRDFLYTVDKGLDLKSIIERLD